MTQIQNISKYDEKSTQQAASNNSESYEQVVEALVEQGLPRAFSPDNYITKIAKAYDISTQEARSCLKLAIKQLESSLKTEEEPQEQLYAQCGYYYPSNTKQTEKPKDGMDSLSSLGSYNRLMFGIR